MNIIQKIQLPNRAIKILILLLSADLFYILLHMVSKVARFLDLGDTIREEAFSLTKDLGLAESFQYTKEFWIFIFFTWLIYRNKNFAYTGWALMYAYLLLDDMLSIHELFATFTFEKLGISPEQTLFLQVRYQDFGEIGISLLFGVLFLSMITVAYFRGDLEIRTTFHYLIGGLLLLVFFGVIADFADRFFSVETQKNLLQIVDIIEDGGEMLAMSIICWYVYTLTDPVPVSVQV